MAAGALAGVAGLLLAGSEADASTERLGAGRRRRATRRERAQRLTEGPLLAGSAALAACLNPERRWRPKGDG